VSRRPLVADSDQTPGVRLTLARHVPRTARGLVELLRKDSDLDVADLFVE
jgi:hypothetical protein